MNCSQLALKHKTLNGACSKVRPRMVNPEPYCSREVIPPANLQDWKAIMPGVS
jgi:hypothetical protein